MMGKPLKFGVYGDAKLELVTRRIEGVLEYCAEHSIQFVDFRRASLLPDLQTPAPWRNRVDGVIALVGSYLTATSEEWAAWMLAGGVPVISLTSDWLDPRVPAVIGDNSKLAKTAVEFLRKCGCQSYLYVGLEHALASLQRSEVFESELKKTASKVVVHHGKHRYQGTYEDDEKVQQDERLIGLLKKMPKPLAVWALNDAFAVAVCKACARLNLEIPAQVSILGTDDTTLSRIHLPTISSIHTPGKEAGYLAAKLLADAVQGNRVKPLTQLAQFKIVERQSTNSGAPRKDGIHEAWQFIQDHACEGITIDQVMQVTKGSRRSFQDRFVNQFGHSPHEEIQRVRLERAKQLLRETTLTINRISDMLGFQENAAFTKFFRNQMKIAPSEYRKEGPAD